LRTNTKCYQNRKTALDGHEAIFDTHMADKDRVQVLLSFLSSYPQPLQLDAEDIEIK